SLKAQPSGLFGHSGLHSGTMNLAQAVDPLQYPLWSIGQQTQRFGAKSVSGVIDELAALRDACGLVRNFRTRRKEHKSTLGPGDRCCSLGDRMIGVINDADRTFFGAQCRSMTCWQGR